MGPVRDLQENFDVVAGSGEECTPGERDLCGDGKPALTARFLHPKGIHLVSVPLFPVFVFSLTINWLDKKKYDRHKALHKLHFLMKSLKKKR